MTTERITIDQNMRLVAINGVATKAGRKHGYGRANKRVAPPVVVPVRSDYTRYVLLAPDEVWPEGKSVAEETFTRACAGVGLTGANMPRLRFFALMDGWDFEDEREAGH